MRRRVIFANTQQIEWAIFALLCMSHDSTFLCEGFIQSTPILALLIIYAYFLYETSTEFVGGFQLYGQVSVACDHMGWAWAGVDWRRWRLSTMWELVMVLTNVIIHLFLHPSTTCIVAQDIPELLPSTHLSLVPCHLSFPFSKLELPNLLHSQAAA